MKGFCSTILGLLFGLVPLHISIALAMPPEGYELTFQDEFDDLALGTEGAQWRDHFAHWGVRYLDGNADQGYKLSDSALTADGEPVSTLLAQSGRFGSGPDFMHQTVDGRLILQTFPNPAPTSFDELPYLASMISGQDLPSQHLGYWEVRFRAAHIPAGHHFALWLLPDTHIWPPEIDLLEVLANEPGRFFANTHGLDAPEITSYNVDDWDDWHVIGFEWTADEMIWRLDDEIVRRHAARLASEHKFYILASFEIGSRWPGPVTDETDWPGRFEIDYIRVYQRVENE